MCPKLTFHPLLSPINDVPQLPSISGLVVKSFEKIREKQERWKLY